MFRGGDQTFMQLQAGLDGVMKGTVYAGHFPPSEGRLLQLIQPDYGYLRRTRITQGRFSLSGHNLEHLLEGDQAQALHSALRDDPTAAVEQEEHPFSLSFDLVTTRNLTASAKVSAKEVPLTVVLTGQTGRTTCATISLNQVRVEKLKAPIPFFATHFGEPSRLMKQYCVRRRWWGSNYLKFYVVIGVYHAKFDIQTTDAWKAGVEAGAEVLPPLAGQLVGGAEGSQAAHVNSAEPKLLAIRVMKIVYDLKWSKLTEIEMETMRMPQPLGRWIPVASFDDSYDNLDSDEPDRCA